MRLALTTIYAENMQERRVGSWFMGNFGGENFSAAVLLLHKWEKIGDNLYLNPGSISIPKQGSRHSYSKCT